LLLRNFVIRNFVIRNFVIRNFDIRNLVPALKLLQIGSDSYDADRTRLGMRRCICEHLSRYQFKTINVALALCHWTIFKEISQFKNFVMNLPTVRTLE
jgi:hypothetical protein